MGKRWPSIRTVCDGLRQMTFKPHGSFADELFRQVDEYLKSIAFQGPIRRQDGAQVTQTQSSRA